MIRIITVFYFLFSISYYAQQSTGTDIWLLEMNYKNGIFNYNNPLNVTNKEGYDNQPAFSPDNQYLLYSAIHGDKQADIYKYDIRSKTTTRLTETPESEFSPTFMLDNKSISSVLVEKDSSQRLWSFSLAGKEPQLIMDVDSIGYHCWINTDSLVLFVLTQPFSLQSVNIKTQQVKIIASSIGRAIHWHNGKILFTQQIDSLKWICSIDSKNNISKIISCLEKSEDFGVMKSGTLMMGQGSRLFKFDLNTDKRWVEIADLKTSGISKITRIVISRDQQKIALVDSK